jgi:NAD(P)-dependent dehydrogenase (short-subunit alcohol dehydrogenase family)
MTKSIADELGHQGINVTVVHPGVTRTEAELSEYQQQVGKSNAIGRIVDAAEVAWVITFLASPKSIAVTGDAVAVGGGQLGPIFY